MENVTMSLGVRIRLSLMMFLQFMMFAVWWVPLAAYLGKMGVDGTQRALILSSMAIGCLVSPVIGMIADRHFNSEKVLFFVNLLCAGFLFFAARTECPTTLFWILLAAMFCYMPTWGLTSAVAMANSPAEQFPQIRVFGSIGWVASGIFSLVAVKLMNVKEFDGTALPLYFGAAVSLVGALVALVLPATPPPAKGQKASIMDSLGLRSLTLMKDANFAVFIGVSLLVMIPFGIYWSYFSMYLDSMGYKLLTFTQNLGQAAEMVFMLLVTVALKKMGVKKAMLLGLFCLLVRYASFLASGMSPGLAWLVYIGILVHGIIYGFFFVGGQIYINRVAPREMQAQAQGFIFLVTFGIGLLVANFVN
ncbi:MAG: hypothetical protein A2283_23450, partial [Lentisphaerae bacterium RIFOXYA12_FULL_48_11]